MKIQKSLADSIKYMNEANPTEKVLSLKALEALEKVADGKATKIIIPSEIQNLASLTTSLGKYIIQLKNNRVYLISAYNFVG